MAELVAVMYSLYASLAAFSTWSMLHYRHPLAIARVRRTKSPLVCRPLLLTML